MPVLRFAAVALAALAALPALAQEARLSATAPRVLFAVADSVKLDDGTRGLVVSRLTYDPEAGLYVSEMTAGDRTLRRTIHRTTNAGPTPQEAAAAERLVRADPEIAPLLADASGEVFVQGGFPLIREAGHPCGPGGRCVMYDVYQAEGDDRERIRFVIVDLRALRVLDADADPDADTNFANPAARRHSRR